MDVFGWAREIAEKLQIEFGDRVAFVGIQGSRARGEAREGSDIDLVLLLDTVNADDLLRCHSLIESMPRSELACGFVGSVRALASWPRHELFQFYNDTKPIVGNLPEVGPFTREDAMQAARINASGIYHGACHAIAFEGDAARETLRLLFKSAFFALQALQYARTGAYHRSKDELSYYLDGDEARILEVSRNWESCSPFDDAELNELADLLLRWAEKLMCTMGDGKRVSICV